MMSHINVTRLQETLYDFYHLYNLSFAFSIVTCPATDNNQDKHCSDDNVHNLQEEHNNNAIFSLFNLFSSMFENSNNSLATEDTEVCQKVECISVLDVNLNKKLSTYFELFFVLTFICATLWFISGVIRFVRRKLFKSSKDSYQEYTQDNDENECNQGCKMNYDNQNCKIRHISGDNSKPIRICFAFVPSNGFVRGNVDQVFDSTLSLFLKQLDSYLGFEIQQHIDDRSAKSSSPLSNSTSSDTLLQSPRVRRKWSQPQDIMPSAKNSYTNEKNLRNWMIFETLCKRLKWLQPKCLQNSFHSDRIKDKDETLNILLTFLRQNCLTKLVDWNVSVLLVNYTLFLLDQIFKHSSEQEKSDEVLRLIRFESIGSAADGTSAGKLDQFAVMFVFEFNQATDIDILHNNYCDDISPGYVVLNVNDIDNKNILKANKCLYKAHIRDKYGWFLLVDQIEDLVDGMLRKAVRKLNTFHKYKMERLPFRLSMSSSRTLELNIDASLFSGMGVDLFNIFVKFTPSVCIESSEFAFLPKLYAVPTARSDHREHWEEKNKRVGALSKLFHRTNHLRLPSNLLWNISVAKLETDIRLNKMEQFHKSNTESCHEECLMILKGLFSSRNKNTLLNKGEIAPYVLSSVVDFLLMESPISAWEMSQLRNRVSDAVHFLRSAYTNVWLPNFVIHNPHLAKKYPSFRLFSALLTGRQQNLLADLDNNTAKKSLAYIESKLKETGISEFINEEYSEDMWEYEFFLFG